MNTEEMTAVAVMGGGSISDFGVKMGENGNLETEGTFVTTLRKTFRKFSLGF